MYFKKNCIFDDDSDLFDEKLRPTYLDLDVVRWKARTRLTEATYCNKAHIENSQ